jgi:hypothetical protein
VHCLSNICIYNNNNREREKSKKKEKNCSETTKKNRKF